MLRNKNALTAALCRRFMSSTAGIVPMHMKTAELGLIDIPQS